MHSIATVLLDKRRPALILTRESKLQRLTWVTVAPITSTIRGISSEVSCDRITTVRSEAVGATIGLLHDDQELELTRAIGDAFDLLFPWARPRSLR